MVYIPVSYTHLRAHETVLDLVCRLLLEKKKYRRKEKKKKYDVTWYEYRMYHVNPATTTDLDDHRVKPD